MEVNPEAIRVEIGMTINPKPFTDNVIEFEVVAKQKKNKIIKCTKYGR